MKLFAPHITDGYKLGHATQFSQDTDFVTSNFTPRDFSYAQTTEETRTNKMVFVGLQYAVKEFLINLWNETFFSQDKEKVLQRFSRRVSGYLGPSQGAGVQKMLSDLHDIGYLPIKIKALPEGSRVNPGIPVFTITNTIKGFGPLVNYLETVLSNSIWPMCNSASLMEQYYMLAKKYGNRTGASEEFWLPFAIHNFAMRGHRGVEDSIISSFGHSLFNKGTDTFAVIDFIEDYYNGNSDNEFIAGSVNASEHATVCQQIALNGYGHTGELEALRHFLVNVYPTGIFSYVADSRDYWDVISNISTELKDVILSRGPNESGQPGVLTFRPDSSIDTPYEVILGYNVRTVNNLEDDAYSFVYDGDYDAIFYEGKYHTVSVEYDVYGDPERLEIKREISEEEAKGTLQVLWDIFSGTEVEGSNVDADGNRSKYHLLDSHVRVIYGEAISLGMAQKIYSGMEAAGWSVGNVFFGVGSWAFIGNSSRDSYGIACKATNSVVAGEEVPLQKDPKGTSSFKKSARGRLKVVKNGSIFVLMDNVVEEEENSGELKDFFVDGKIINEQSYSSIVELLKI